MSAPALTRWDVLAHLVRDDVDEATALMRLAAYHADATEPMIPVRKTEVATGDHVYPRPEVLGDLVGLMIQCTRHLFTQCQTESDDLLVATFAMYLTTAIHPFDDANGRVALGFGQYLLMKKWGAEQPPLALEPDVHDTVGEAFAALDVKNPGQSAEDYVAAYEALVRRIAEATLDTLWQTGELVAAAHFLAQAGGREFTARS
jgi:Fic family protein